MNTNPNIVSEGMGGFSVIWGLFSSQMYPLPMSISCALMFWISVDNLFTYSENKNKMQRENLLNVSSLHIWKIGTHSPPKIG